jgi:hypothetical protein
MNLEEINTTTSGFEGARLHPHQAFQVGKSLGD